jgi:hypothetical protein
LRPKPVKPSTDCFEAQTIKPPVPGFKAQTNKLTFPGFEDQPGKPSVAFDDKTTKPSCTPRHA